MEESVHDQHAHTRPLLDLPHRMVVVYQPSTLQDWVVRIGPISSVSRVCGGEVENN